LTGNPTPLAICLHNPEAGEAFILLTEQGSAGGKARVVTRK